MSEIQSEDSKQFLSQISDEQLCESRDIDPEWLNVCGRTPAADVSFLTPTKPFWSKSQSAGASPVYCDGQSYDVNTTFRLMRHPDCAVQLMSLNAGTAAPV